MPGRGGHALRGAARARLPPPPPPPPTALESARARRARPRLPAANRPRHWPPARVTWEATGARARAHGRAGVGARTAPRRLWKVRHGGRGPPRGGRGLPWPRPLPVPVPPRAPRAGSQQEAAQGAVSGGFNALLGSQPPPPALPGEAPKGTRKRQSPRTAPGPARPSPPGTGGASTGRLRPSPRGRRGQERSPEPRERWHPAQHSPGAGAVVLSSWPGVSPSRVPWLGEDAVPQGLGASCRTWRRGSPP